LQGYDDIPKEILDRDAKKVHILLIPYYLLWHLFHSIHISYDQIISRSMISYSQIPVAARGLG
jgi:hypothetical protein